MDTYQVTKKVSAKTGDIIMKVSEKRGYRLYNETEMYGKEPKISEKNFAMLLSQNRLERVETGYNYALGSRSEKYKVV